MVLISFSVAMSIEESKNVWYYLHFITTANISMMWYCFGPLVSSSIKVEYFALMGQLTLFGYIGIQLIVKLIQIYGEEKEELSNAI